jgi:hypothetical protein
MILCRMIGKLYGDLCIALGVFAVRPEGSRGVADTLVHVRPDSALSKARIENVAAMARG